MQEATQDIQEEGMTFLETVTEKLKQKLAQIYETLLRWANMVMSIMITNRRYCNR